MNRVMALTVTVLLFALVVSFVGFNSFSYPMTGNFVKEDFENSFKFKSGDGVILDDQAITFLKGASKKSGSSGSFIKGDQKVLISLVPHGRDSESMFPKEIVKWKYELYGNSAMFLLDFNDELELKNDWALITFPGYSELQYFVNLKEGDSRIINGHKVSLVQIDVKNTLSGINNKGEVLLDVNGEVIILRTFNKPVRIGDLFVVVDGLSYDKAKFYFIGVNKVEF